MDKLEIYSVPTTRKARKFVKNKETGKIEDIEYDKEIENYFFKINLKQFSVKSKIFKTTLLCFKNLYEQVIERPSILSEVGIPDIDKIEVILSNENKVAL